MAEVSLVTKAWRSGAAWAAQCLAQSIAESGSKVTFIAPLAHPVEREPTHRNINRVTLSRELADESANKGLRLVMSLRRILGAIVAVAIERIHTRNFVFSIPEPLIFTLPMFLGLRISGARIFFLVHDAVPHAWRLGKYLRWLELACHALSYRLANSLLVMTTPLKESLIQNFGIPPRKIQLVPHGPYTIRDVAPVPWSGRLLQFGTIRSNKSVLEVIEGVRIARREQIPVVLVIAGEPHADELDYWEKCLAVIAKDPEGFEVRAGFLSDDEVPQLLDGVDAFVLAYQGFDSQSGVGVLAGLNGRPVIGTGSGGLKELFLHGMVGEEISLPVTADSVFEAIAKFRRIPPGAWQQASLDGAERLRSRMSWTSVSSAYLDIIRNKNTAE